MAEFAHPRLRDLEKQLLLGPPEIRRRHADRIEALLSMLEPQREYAYEFLYFRVTGFRPDSPPLEAWRGEELAPDLTLLLEHLSAAAPTPIGDCPEPVLGVDEAAEELRVAVRTLLRWRRRGLVSRKYVFRDGRVRTGIRRSALQKFVETHGELVRQSAGFSRLDEREREDLLRETRRLMQQEGLTLTAAAGRVARSAGRAVETVRRAVLQAEELDGLSGARGRLEEDEKRRIYDAYNQGQSVGALCRRFQRSRASIYRIINEARARGVLEPSASQRQFIAGPEFSAPDADRKILIDERLPAPSASGGPARPLSSAEKERVRFRKCNYLKWTAHALRSRINPRRYVPSALLDEVEACLKQAREVKQALVQDHLPLIVSVARKHAGPLVGLPDLITEGALCVGEAIDQFDWRRGDRFERYARWCLLRRFARTVPAENYAAPRPAEADDSTVLLSLREGLGKGQGELTEEEKRALLRLLGVGDDEAAGGAGPPEKA